MTARGVSAEKQRRMAYALWNYGRSTNPDQQAAVMLYVHSLMGDGAPGEVDPSAIGPAVQELYGRIARESARLHGPYRIDADIPGGLKVGKPATGTVRLIAASGAPVPGVVISLEAKGANGVPARVRTNAKGVASVTFTPTAADGVSIEARSESIASTLPRIFTPTTDGGGPQRPAPRRRGEPAGLGDRDPGLLEGDRVDLDDRVPRQGPRGPGQPRPGAASAACRRDADHDHLADPRPVPHQGGDPLRRARRP